MAVLRKDSLEYIEDQLDRAERLYDGLTREAGRVAELRTYWRNKLEEALKNANE